MSAAASAPPLAYLFLSRLASTIARVQESTTPFEQELYLTKPGVPAYRVNQSRVRTILTPATKLG